MPRRPLSAPRTILISLTIAVLTMLTALVAVPASAESQPAPARAAAPKVAIKKGTYVGLIPEYEAFAVDDLLTFKVVEHRQVIGFRAGFKCPVSAGAEVYDLNAPSMDVSRSGRFSTTWHPYAPEVTATVSGRLTRAGTVKKASISVTTPTCSRTASWKAARISR